jgi:hypothetical protein
MSKEIKTLKQELADHVLLEDELAKKSHLS